MLEIILHKCNGAITTLTIYKVCINEKLSLINCDNFRMDNNLFIVHSCANEKFTVYMGICLDSHGGIANFQFT